MRSGREHHDLIDGSPPPFFLVINDHVSSRAERRQFQLAAAYRGNSDFFLDRKYLSAVALSGVNVKYVMLAIQGLDAPGESLLVQTGRGDSADTGEFAFLLLLAACWGSNQQKKGHYEQRSNAAPASADFLVTR